MGDGEPLRLRLADDYQDTISFHRWFAMRGTGMARAAVAFTTSPEWLSDPAKFDLIANGHDDAIASAITEDRRDRSSAGISPPEAGQRARLLDMCAGIGTVAAMAARFGFDALSVEFSVVPHLIDRVLHDFAVSLAGDSGSAPCPDGQDVAGWRGFGVEVEDFADAVWRGAKERLGELFEATVDIRLWARIVPCPSCGWQVPVLSNVRLSRDTALDISPVADRGGETEFPRFGLLRTEFPDRKGTYERGICSCPHCHFKFRFQGYDLIPLRSVPVAVRMRGSGSLDEIDSPGTYIKNVAVATYDSLAASAPKLGDLDILVSQQPIFHDSKGQPISAAAALLPRQRAHFAALAESMSTQSAMLARRVGLTDEHRFAVRCAVALLISAQIDYVNMYTHWLADKPHPSTLVGPFRVGGLFTEVGGYWLERFWQNRLRHLLDLLRENSKSGVPVQAIQADAADIPLGDATVSAVVWDPPYHDNIDYDAVGEPYQAILAAMVPDLVDGPVVAPTLPHAERMKRYQRELLRQAGEARRVVSADGSIGVFWPASEPAELERFLVMIAPAGLKLLRAVRLDVIRPRRVAAASAPRTYLLVLQPVPTTGSAVVVDAKKVLALATAGAPSLYDGLAELLESAWDPAELSERIPAEFQGSPRQRLIGFLASHPEPEQLLVELGRITLIRELVNRGAHGTDLRALDGRGLAQQLLDQLGFAVARPVRFSIRAALRECEKVQNRLELADSTEAIRGVFLTGCGLIERILRYASLAWSHLGFGNRWDDALGQVISAAAPGRPYRGPDKLTFGQHELLFARLPATFSSNDLALETALFTRIAQAMKKSRVHDKLSDLVALRNGVEHNNEAISALPLPQLRRKCHAVLAEARAVLADIDKKQLLPLTVRPEQERRDSYGRRTLRVLDPDGIAIETLVENETDLSEPLIYFAASSSPRDAEPRFLRASIVEEIFGLPVATSQVIAPGA